MLSYIVSDLHLPAGDNPATARFLHFCDALVRDRADHLYILGDLVDAWIGDDAGVADYAPLLAALRALTEAGTLVTLLAGNHDFLYGEAFRAATGAWLAPDPLPVDLGAGALLLSHGDALCLEDADYQRLRSELRSSAWQMAFLTQSQAERRGFAQRLRTASATAAAGKAAHLMDVTPGALRAWHAAHGVETLIHGHTHRPAVHRAPRREGFACRVVTGCWYEGAEIVRCARGRLDLLPLAALPGMGREMGRGMVRGRGRDR